MGKRRKTKTKQKQIPPKTVLFYEEMKNVNHLRITAKRNTEEGKKKNAYILVVQSSVFTKNCKTSAVSTTY